MSSFLAYCINTVGYLRLVTISDLVDIAILTFLFYKLIGLFRRTNAAKVARAVLLIVVAMWLAYQFNLHALNFLLSRAVELGFLALVIIFQPEIRRFLERIGSNNVSLLSRYFRPQAPSSDLEQAIDETVEAYAEMSKNRVGALMVFERGTDLSNIISSGTPFQSTVTSELLKNLFYPNAPLHDGAVVVRDGRIAAAACMLPHVGADEPEQGTGHAPPGRHRHERAVRRRGGHRLRGDRGHLHGGQWQPAPPPVPRDPGADPAQ